MPGTKPGRAPRLFTQEKRDIEQEKDMTMGFRLLPAGLEEAQFKRVPEGWLFTSICPWVFGRSRTYLVNDAQKPALAARVRRARYLRLVLMLPTMLLLATALVMDPTLMREPSLKTALLFGAFVALVTAAITACDYLSVRPLLHDVPRSSQRIGVADMMRSQGKAMSVTSLTVFSSLFFLAAAANAVQAFTVTHAGWMAGLAAIVFGLFAAGFTGALIVKLRSHHAGE
jgi:hypothetical protein